MQDGARDRDIRCQTRTPVGPGAAATVHMAASVPANVNVVPTSITAPKPARARRDCTSLVARDMRSPVRWVR